VFLVVDAQLTANVVILIVSVLRCEPLSVAVCVSDGGGLMAVVSSMLVEMGFHWFFNPQFISAFEISAGVVSAFVVAV